MWTRQCFDYDDTPWGVGIPDERFKLVGQSAHSSHQCLPTIAGDRSECRGGVCFTRLESRECFRGFVCP